MQDSEDTRHMFKALTDLGVEMKVDWEQREMVVWGCNGRFPSQGAELFLGNAGTAMRYHCKTEEHCAGCVLPHRNSFAAVRLVKAASRL